MNCTCFTDWKKQVISLLLCESLLLGPKKQGSGWRLGNCGKSSRGKTFCSRELWEEFPENFGEYQAENWEFIALKANMKWIFESFPDLGKYNFKRCCYFFDYYSFSTLHVLICIICVFMSISSCSIHIIGLLIVDTEFYSYL